GRLTGGPLLVAGTPSCRGRVSAGARHVHSRLTRYAYRNEQFSRCTQVTNCLALWLRPKGHRYGQPSEGDGWPPGDLPGSDLPIAGRDPATIQRQEPANG